MSELSIYRAKDGTIELSVKLENDTVWLPQADIAALFGVNVPAVSKHIKNIYGDGELEKKATLSTMEIVRKEGARNVKRSVEHFNLDMILSIGYRVNSRRATQFRIWATTLLKQHLTKGYTLNEPRLEGAKIAELQSAVSLIRKAINHQQLSLEASSGLLRIIAEYAATWSMLEGYESAKLSPPQTTKASAYVLTHDDAAAIVRALAKHLKREGSASKDFGVERGEALAVLLDRHAELAKARQSIEERATTLLYDLIKDRPFMDGNKRIAAFLFIVFLTRTEYLTGYRGERKFNDNALVALVLLIAESGPEEEHLMKKLVMNFVHG